jgi:hypothetical protein
MSAGFSYYTFEPKEAYILYDEDEGRQDPHGPLYGLCSGPDCAQETGEHEKPDD